MAKEKRKGLMEVLAEYRREQNSDGGTKGKGPVASGKTYGKTLKNRIRKKMPVVLRSWLPRRKLLLRSL